MKLVRIAVILFFALLLSPALLSGFQLGLDFHIGDLGFTDERTSSQEDFPVSFPWGISLYGSHNITDELEISTGFFSDAILNNISYTLLTYRQDIFSLGVGPFFGFFNTPTSILKPGISTSVRVDVPGLLFLSFRADSTIGGRLVQEGDYLQERSDITAGFYVPNIIASINIITKNYTRRTLRKEIVDSFSEYSLRTDIYQKNVPYRIALTFGYQQRKKSFIDLTKRTPVDHILNSIILGTEFSLDISDFLVLSLNVDNSIYTFGSAGDTILELPTEGIGIYLFDASLGFSLNIDSLIEG